MTPIEVPTCRTPQPTLEHTAESASDDFIGGPLRSRPGRPDPAWATDEQADGCWANLVRAYEDGPCN